MTLTETGRVRFGIACGVAVLAIVASGCEGCPSSQGEADCQSQVRIDGRVYTSYGFSHSAASEFGVADQAECHDAGCDAPGSVFPANPRQVTVWSFRGYATKDVVGVRFDNADSFGVFVADDVPQAGSDRIYAELGKRQR